jgi:hypothetical protein
LTFLHAPHPKNTKIKRMQIHLNVGGNIHVTTGSTLGKVEYFRKLIEGASEGESIFVDRDGTHFRYILNWIRGSDVLPESLEVLRELCVETDFYMLDDMKRMLNFKIEHSQTVVEALTHLSTVIQQKTT